MSRNITIVVVILIIVLISFYLVWLRNKFSADNPVEIAQTTASPSPTINSSPSPSASKSAIMTATQSGRKSATSTAKPR